MMETVKGYTVDDLLKMGITELFTLGFTKEELDKAVNMIEEHGRKRRESFDNADNLWYNTHNIQLCVLFFWLRGIMNENIGFLLWLTAGAYCTDSA